MFGSKVDIFFCSYILVGEENISSYIDDDGECGICLVVVFFLCRCAKFRLYVSTCRCERCLDRPSFLEFGKVSVEFRGSFGDSCAKVSETCFETSWEFSEVAGTGAFVKYDSIDVRIFICIF